MRERLIFASVPKRSRVLDALAAIVLGVAGAAVLVAWLSA